MTSEFDAIRIATQSVYEKNATSWDRQRPKSLDEKAWLNRFATLVSGNRRLLDLGCGTGDPIAGHFLGLGYRVVGVDYAETMIAIAQERFPAAEWHVQDMRELNVSGQFAGIYSWDGFFHLSAAEQRRVLPRLAQFLTSDGALLLTVGPREGEVTGKVCEDDVYHASLSPQEYESILDGLGFDKVTLAIESEEVNLRTVLLASRRVG